MRTLALILPVALLTFALEYALAVAAMRFTGVRKEFSPFTPLPVLSGVVGGFVFATLAFAVVKFTSSYPNRTFLLIAVVALAISFALPARLSFTKSKRFAGVTPSAQMVLVLMHTAEDWGKAVYLDRSCLVPKCLPILEDNFRVVPGLRANRNMADSSPRSPIVLLGHLGLAVGAARPTIGPSFSIVEA
ncbi:MAG: hypothetical protein ACRD22_16715 [Terriglobia bacterium]